MHSLGAVLIQFDRARAAIRPQAARDAAAQAQLDTLLFRYEQPQEELAWGVDDARGFRFDWCVVGGRFSGWGREVRSLMARQRIRPTARPIPRFLESNAIWSEDLGRVRLTMSLFPIALLTPYGDWLDAPGELPNFGKMSARARRALAAWRTKIRQAARAFPDCLAVGVDYHF
jgi:hypothetical protein